MFRSTATRPLPMGLFGQLMDVREADLCALAKLGLISWEEWSEPSFEAAVLFHLRLLQGRQIAEEVSDSLGYAPLATQILLSLLGDDRRAVR